MEVVGCVWDGVWDGVEDEMDVGVVVGEVDGLAVANPDGDAEREGFV